MENISKIESIKILKHLDYIRSEYEYMREIINTKDNLFLDEVNKFIEGHPDVKKLLNLKEKNIDTKEDNNKEDIEIETEAEVEKTSKKVEKSQKIKNIYRKIAKITHPDSTKNDVLNNLYRKATYFYEISDINSLYKICEDLEIKYEIDEEEINKMYEEIEDYKERITFLERTFTWDWHKAKNKQRVIMEYIKDKYL